MQRHFEFDPAHSLWNATDPIRPMTTPSTVRIRAKIRRGVATFKHILPVEVLTSTDDVNCRDPAASLVGLVEISSSIQVLPGDVRWRMHQNSFAPGVSLDAPVPPTTSRDAASVGGKAATPKHGRTSR